MANEDYRSDFPKKAVISVCIGRDPETNEVLGPICRGMTNRELSIDSQIEVIKNGIGEIFQKRKDNDTILTSIEHDLEVLVDKVRRCAEGAS